MTPNQSKSFSSTDRTETRGGLHAAIMNLPCKFEAAWQTPAPSEWVEGYVNGHRDTRHAAAELALQSDAINAELLEALQLAEKCLSERTSIADDNALIYARAALKKATA